MGRIMEQKNISIYDLFQRHTGLKKEIVHQEIIPYVQKLNKKVSELNTEDIRKIMINYLLDTTHSLSSSKDSKNENN